MSTLDELISTMNTDERKALRKKLDAYDEKDEAVDWGSIGDNELEARKHALFQKTRETTRRKRLESELGATDG